MSTEMIRQKIALAISAWAGIDANLIKWPNQHFDVPDTGLWFAVDLQFGNSQMAGMADTPLTRINGAVVVRGFARIDTGTAQLGSVLDGLGAHLAYYTSGHLEMLAASRTELGDDGNGFYQINLRVPFRYN